MPTVAPVVPDAQKNRGPDIFLDAMRTGLAGLSQFAQLRRQSEADVAKLALQERMSQEEHEMGMRKLDMAAEMIPYQQRLSDAQSGLMTERARAYSEGTATAAQQAIRFNRQKEALFNEVNKTAEQLRLDDPDFQTKEPIQFAANVMQFQDMYGLAPMPEIKGAIKRYQGIADQQKITIKPDAVKDEMGTWTSGKPRSVPIWKIAKNLSDPATREQTLNDLRASGHITESTETVPGQPTNLWEKVFGAKSTTKKVEKRSPALQELIEQKAPEFERQKSRVPSVILPRSSAAGTSPTDLPEPDLPELEDDPQASLKPDYGPDMEALLGAAQTAIQKGAPMVEVMRRLQNDFGVDPNQLWAT